MVSWPVYARKQATMPPIAMQATAFHPSLGSREAPVRDRPGGEQIAPRFPRRCRRCAGRVRAVERVDSLGEMGGVGGRVDGVDSELAPGDEVTVGEVHQR